MIMAISSDDAADHKLHRKILIGARQHWQLLPARLARSARPPFKPCQIVGSERNRLMIPPAATAPAPM